MRLTLFITHKITCIAPCFCYSFNGEKQSLKASKYPGALPN